MAAPDAGIIARTDALMLFDGICNFCSGSVQFVLKRTPGSSLKFCAMQTKRGQEFLAALEMAPDRYETFVLIENGQPYFKSEAIIRLSAYMKGPWSFLGRLYSFIPPTIRDWFYDRIANNRYRILGQKPQCMVPAPEIQNRFLT